MNVELEIGGYKVRIDGNGLEESPWVITGVTGENAASAVAIVEQMVIKNMMDKTGLDWFMAGTELLGIADKRIAKLTVGVRGFDKTRDFYFDVTEAFGGH